MLHPWTVWTAKKLGEEARNLTRRLFPDDPLHPGRRHNDEADAFRHAYWNYRMTQTFGPERARAFANAYEISTLNPIGERKMDLYNNKIGRDLAVGATGSPVDNVRRAVARGQTRIVRSRNGAMKPRARFWTGVAALVALAAIGYCWLYIYAEVYTVTVVNRSTHVLTDVRLIVPGRTRVIGTLAPGANGWVYTMAANEGTLDVAFAVNGEKKYEKIDYVGGGLGRHYTIEVTPALTAVDLTPVR
jgi:hypothetical protein